MKKKWSIVARIFTGMWNFIKWLIKWLWININRPLIVAVVSIWYLNRIYANYNMIDTLNKTILTLPYAYTYNYMGATNERENRLREILDNVPIQVSIDEEKHFWFGIVNKNYKSLKDVSLTLIFPKDIEVKNWKEQGWIEYQPNEQYTYNFGVNIHNGMGQNSKPLILKFSKKGDYPINYYISGEDIQRKDKNFTIRVN
ncbi:hypothetical protein FJY84_09315 [Candidatus Bathyarchaeota archaeon]|nr:hypothetical protein [Candidatus Bathyarchaeota archaeon]